MSTEERLFNAWWKVNHPWDWWASRRDGNPLPHQDRLLVAEVCRQAFYAANGLAIVATNANARRFGMIVELLQQAQQLALETTVQSDEPNDTNPASTE